MASTFEVLAEPRRRQILDLLRDGERPVGDLVARLAVTQPTVSKHLRVLREAGSAYRFPRPRHVIRGLDAIVYRRGQVAIGQGRSRVKREQVGRNAPVRGASLERSQYPQVMAQAVLASAGVEGTTTLSPGIAIAQASMLWECCAPNRTPPPLAVRITRGRATWPFVM